MRDPKRITLFCKDLAGLWSKVPDWRFGQLVSNIMRMYMSETGRDPFFVEDDELMERMKAWFKENVNEV